MTTRARPEKAIKLRLESEAYHERVLGTSIVITDEDQGTAVRAMRGKRTGSGSCSDIANFVWAMSPRTAEF